MNKLLLALLTVCCFSTAAADSIQPSTSPNLTQRNMAERGYGMFVHFGMNTFLNQEWSDGTAEVSVYAPDSLNCDQWVKVAKDAGFRYVLLVTKHHDGFCLWPSACTDYDVESSPVPTDVVKEVSEACRRYGLGFAVYYSLWDRHEPTYTCEDFTRYVDFMKGQLTELLSNYGEVCELWLDGAWDKKGSEWNIPALYDLVKTLQPDCAFGVNGTIASDPADRDGFTDVLPDLMTTDNTYYIRYFPSDFRLWDPKIAHKDDHKQYLHNGQSYYMPFEHTLCLSKEWNWFQKDHLLETRDLDELEELFYWATDNGNELVINIPPDRHGRIREHEANAAIALGARLGIQPGTALPRNGRCISHHSITTASSTWNNEADFAPSKATDGGMQTRWAAQCAPAQLEITLNPAERFNKISIFEYTDQIMLDNISNRRENRITRYSVDIFDGKEWTPIYYSTSPMGDCKVIKFPRYYNAEKIRLNVLEATDSPSIYEFNVIDDPRICPAD